MELYTYFVFKEGKLTTIVQSNTEGSIRDVKDEQCLIVPYDYVVTDPQDAEKQKAEWEKKVEAEKCRQE